MQDDRLSGIVETLRGQLEEASLSLSGMEEERQRLEGQVLAREEEIARLGRQIGGDSNLEKVNLGVMARARVAVGLTLGEY